MEYMKAFDDDDEDDEEKKKKKKGKKSAAKAAEEAKLQLLKQKQDYLKALKVRVNMEWEINQNRREFFDVEFQERMKAFKNSYNKLKDIEDVWEEYVSDLRSKHEWAEYLKCNRLPNCSSFPELTEFIFKWTELDTSSLMDDCIRKTNSVMKLFKDIEDIFKDPGPHRPPNFIKDLKELRTQLRNLLQQDIDRATFYLFSRIERDMESINVTTSKYSVKCPYFVMNLWAELMTPTPSSRGREVRRARKVVFEEAEVTIVVPPSFYEICMVIRVMWLDYDHNSDMCRSYNCPVSPSFYPLGLFDLFLVQTNIKREIIAQREVSEREMKASIEALPPTPTLSQELLVWESDPQRGVSEEVLFREYEEEDKAMREVTEILNEFEVNLRQRTFLGRILRLDIFHQPPQSKDFRFKHSVTLRQEPPDLKPVDFYVKFPPPELEEQRSSEEHLEKRPVHHGQVNTFLEELNKLIAVQIKPCDSIMWFENPQLAGWDPIHKYWSSEDIHDVNFDEEEGTIEFKTGRLGLIGLHVNRYCNFPYEDWVFEPSDDVGVNFYLKTTKLELYFNIREGKVCLEFMKNSPSKVMNWIFYKYYKPAELLELLRSGGIDIYPEPDASVYIDGIESKHFVIEKNAYQVWGLFSKSFRFKRSKFNQEAGRKNLVFQAQEIHKNHQVDFSLIQTTMCSSYVLDIIEEDVFYKPQSAPGMETCIDLFTLLKNNSTKPALRQMETTCYLLIQTVKEFLGYVRPLSFS